MRNKPRTPVGPQDSEICLGIPEYTLGFSNIPEILNWSPEFQNKPRIPKSVLEFQHTFPTVQNTL